MVSDSTPTILGLALKSATAVAEELLGLEARSFEDAVPESTRQALRGVVDPHDAYPLSLYSDLLQVFAAAPVSQRRLGRRMVDRDLRTGPLRFVLRALRPETWGAVLPQVFSNYHSHGELQIDLGREGTSARLSWNECRGFDAGVWWASLGGFRRVLELSGARGQRWRLETPPGERSDLVAVVRFEVAARERSTWRPPE